MGYSVAVIVAAPSAIPVASPVELIDTMEVSELFQSIDAVTSFPLLSIALNCT